MKKMFILAFAALGMLACTEKNTPENSGGTMEQGVVPGEKGNIIGCWAMEGQYSGYYEIASDGYITGYRYYGDLDYDLEQITIILEYTGEKYAERSAIEELREEYKELNWTIGSRYQYEYAKAKERLTIYDGFFTPTFIIEWIDGSHVYVEGLGMFVRVNPDMYFRALIDARIDDLKIYEEEYEKDKAVVLQAHPKQFYVGNQEWIEFSPGNLQYQASTSTWRFAEHQYDIIGDANININISSTYAGWIDLFGWGTGNNPTLSFLENDDNQIFTDWGRNPISNGGNNANIWRTLTKDEWNYLCNDRANAQNLCNWGTVKGIWGCIILPDDWTTPSGLSFTSSQDDWSSNTYDVTQWSQMEAKGAVFLPAAGTLRAYVNDVGYYGYYWSSTPYDRDGGWNKAYGISLNRYNYRPDCNCCILRGTGLSVRLVR